MRTTTRATVWATAFALLPALATAQQPDPETMARGAQLYGQTCARCHNPRPATERGDRAWNTIMLHMRARANLTKADAEAILVFLQATNGNERRMSAGTPETGDDQAATAKVLAWQLAGLGLPGAPSDLDPTVARRLAEHLERTAAP